MCFTLIRFSNYIICSGLEERVNWVIDIGEATSILSTVLSKYNYKNLDDVFPSEINTTTEFMCKSIHKDLCELLKAKQIKLNGSIKVTLFESHKAWASYLDTIENENNAI